MASKPKRDKYFNMAERFLSSENRNRSGCIDVPAELARLLRRVAKRAYKKGFYNADKFINDQKRRA